MDRLAKVVWTDKKRYGYGAILLPHGFQSKHWSTNHELVRIASHDRHSFGKMN